MFSVTLEEKIISVFQFLRFSYVEEIKSLGEKDVIFNSIYHKSFL